MKISRAIVVPFLMFVWLFSSCSAIPALMPTATPIPPTLTFTPKPTSTPTSIPTSTFTPSPTATATPAIEVAKPAAGKASAAGMILWNSKPLQYVKVLLCEEYDWGGCSGTEYSALTNEKGYYIFKDVKPGQYKLVVNVPNTNWYIYNTQKKETLQADQVQYLEPVHIFKVDVRTIYPVDNSTIQEDRPTLKWTEYPEASYYEVTIWKKGFADIQEWQQTEMTEYTLQTPLPEGYYIWQLRAFNQDGIEIAEAEDVHFTVDKP